MVQSQNRQNLRNTVKETLIVKLKRTYLFFLPFFADSFVVAFDRYICLLKRRRAMLAWKASPSCLSLDFWQAIRQQWLLALCECCIYAKWWRISFHFVAFVLRRHSKTQRYGGHVSTNGPTQNTAIPSLKYTKYKR